MTRFSIAFVFGCCCTAASLNAADKPVKVFILAGQSNMEGHGFVKADPKRNGGKGSLEYLVKDPATADRFKHLVDKEGKWAVRDDVWIHYLDRKGRSRWASGPVRIASARNWASAGSSAMRSTNRSC